MSMSQCDFKQVEQWDLLIIEMKKEHLDEILKWVFSLQCIKKVPILAITYNFDIKDKLLLNNFGIRDYIDTIVHQFFIFEFLTVCLTRKIFHYNCISSFSFIYLFEVYTQEYSSVLHKLYLCIYRNHI